MSKEPSIFERRFVPAGTVILQQGERGSAAFLIQSGRVQVFSEHDGKQVELARLEAGQIFGEMALAVDDPRAASVKALEDCNLIIITRESFLNKLNCSDPTIKAIVAMLIQRLLTANSLVMAKKTDTKSLIEASRTIYDAALQALPKARQRTFQNAIGPKLEEFLAAVRAFDERYPSE
jgi:CRP/FNR family cyclic AMP-dependent transcriptional regulator